MIKTDRLIRRRPESGGADSVKARANALRNKHKDTQLLERSETAWWNLDDMRQARARCLRFMYGDQWADMITVNGVTMSYRKYLMDQGNVVIQTNQIKNRADTIAGVLVKEHNEPVCHAIDRDEQPYGEVMTATMQANCDMNKMSRIYELCMKDILSGGLACAYESYDDCSGPTRDLDTWTTYINPNTLFFETEATDPRFWDISLIGRTFYKSPQQMAALYARSPGDYEALRAIYPNQFTTFRTAESRQVTDMHDADDLVFMRTDDPTRCYVCEVWTMETRGRIRLNDLSEGTEEIIDADDYARRKEVREENRRRKALARQLGWPEEETPYIIGDGYGRDELERNGYFVDTFWYCKHLAPDGTVLWEGESPYPDHRHPFSLCAFPFTDGKFVGYMTDAIDHNIAINRAVVLHDWLLRSQAKGVVVVPKDIIPDNMDMQSFAKSWTAIDGMVYIDIKPGQEGLMPKVFHGASQTFDVGSLIATYSRLMDAGSPVNGALQGKTPNSGTSGTLYAQMTTNASTPIAALMENFHTFVEDMLNRKLQNIAMFYSPERYEKIAGSIETLTTAKLNLNEVGQIKYDLRIKESSSTPVFRAVINQDAKEFLMNGLISFEEYLEIADVPYADKILQKRQAQQAEAQQAGMTPPAPMPEAEEAQPASPLQQLPVGLQ